MVEGSAFEAQGPSISFKNVLYCARPTFGNYGDSAFSWELMHTTPYATACITGIPRSR
jgi:hypothetical protein